MVNQSRAELTYLVAGLISVPILGGIGDEGSTTAAGIEGVTAHFISVQMERGAVAGLAVIVLWGDCGIRGITRGY